ncbi:MAG: AMP-binding protein [Marmoricola sp.]
MADPGAISWFRRPTPTRDDPYAGGTLNVAFQLLDRAVVAGASDKTLLSDDSGELSHAALLEMAAAFGGVLRGFGVVPGDRVVVELAAGAEAVVALLAVARIGAAGVTIPEGLAETQVVRIVGATRPRVVVTADDAAMAGVLAQCAHRPAAVVTTGDQAPGSRSVTWEVVIRAGRTDPAGAVELGAGSPSVLIWPADPTGSEVRLRTTLEQAAIARELADAVPLTTSGLLTALFD